MFGILLDIIRGTLLAQIREYERIADWLKDIGRTVYQLPVSIRQKALAVHGYYLMGRGESARLVGFSQSVPLSAYTPFPLHFHYFTMAVGYYGMKDNAQALSCIELAAENSLTDGMLHCFAGYSRLLGGLSDKVIKDKYPSFTARFNEYKKQYFTGWFSLYGAIVATDLPSTLTLREREVAELAAEGKRNMEIAAELYVSENTVRAHLRSIYQKLEIDRRAMLVKKLM
jgi:LuxR family maltose regulon positive regulatory protein